MKLSDSIREWCGENHPPSRETVAMWLRMAMELETRTEAIHAAVKAHLAETNWEKLQRIIEQVDEISKRNIANLPKEHIE